MTSTAEHAALVNSALALCRLSAPRPETGAGRYVVMVVGGIFAAFAIMGAIGLGIAAIWIANVPSLGDTGAALTAAGTLGFLGLVLGAVTIAAMGTGRRPPAPATDPHAIAAMAANLVKEHGGAVLLMALIAGFAFGDRQR